METSKLNEYLLGDLLRQYAANAREVRLHALMQEGLAIEDANAMPVSREDLEKGAETLRWYSAEARRLLSAESAEPPESR